MLNVFGKQHFFVCNVYSLQGGWAGVEPQPLEVSSPAELGAGLWDWELHLPAHLSTRQTTLAHICKK